MSPSGLGGSSLGDRRDEVTARRPVLAVTFAAAIALFLSGSALAASPQTIYKDLADNGKLDRRYSQADLARAFNVERVMGTDPRKPAAKVPPAPALASSDKQSNRKLPFSGLDLALLTVGGGPLLLIGIGLRRRLSPAPSQARVVS